MLNVECKGMVEYLHQPTHGSSSLENTRFKCPQSLGHTTSPGTVTSLATRTTDRVIKSSFPRHCLLPPPVVPWCWKAALSPVQRRLCLSNESTSCTLVYDFHPRGKALFDGSAAPSPSSVTATVTSHLAAAALAHDATLLCRVWLMVQFALEHKLYHFLSKFRTSADVFVSFFCDVFLLYFSLLLKAQIDV